MSGYLAAIKTAHPELRNSTKLKTTTPNFLRNLIISSYICSCGECKHC